MSFDEATQLHGTTSLFGIASQVAMHSKTAHKHFAPGASGTVAEVPSTYSLPSPPSTPSSHKAQEDPQDSHVHRTLEAGRHCKAHFRNRDLKGSSLRPAGQFHNVAQAGKGTCMPAKQVLDLGTAHSTTAVGGKFCWRAFKNDPQERVLITAL